MIIWYCVNCLFAAVINKYGIQLQKLICYIIKVLGEGEQDRVLPWYVETKILQRLI